MATGALGTNVALLGSNVAVLQVSNNQVQNYQTGINLTSSNTSMGTATIAGNTVTNCGDGISIQTADTSQYTASITGNAISGATGDAGLLLDTVISGTGNWNVSSNTFTNNTPHASWIISQNSSTTCASFVNNQTNNADFLFERNAIGTSTFFLFQTGNTGTVNTMGPITPHTEGCP